jgi:SNF2 family DNA or RNA helicase
MENNKIIIFSEFAEMCKILKRELEQYNPLMIIGETPDKERQTIVDKFNNISKYQILIMSSAGMYGLNLQSANIVINYDLPFSISRLEQRVGRAHRIGQKKNVMVYNLLGKGTADMAIRKIIHAKSKLSDTILSDTPITMQDLQSMLNV